MIPAPFKILEQLTANGRGFNLGMKILYLLFIPKHLIFIELQTVGSFGLGQAYTFLTGFFREIILNLLVSLEMNIL